MDCDTTPRDWREAPILEGARVLAPRPWGRSGHSVEMVEGIVVAVNASGSVRIKIIRTSREPLHPNSAREVCAMPAHSVTVIEGPAGE